MTREDDSWLDAAPTVNRADLARLLGVSTDDVIRWLKQGCPSTGDRQQRRFIVADVFKWHLAQNDAGSAKQRREAAMAEIKELELAREKAELVPAVTVARQVADFVSALQNEFMSIPARCNLTPDLADLVRIEIGNSINQFVEKTDGLST